jgi:hypothetical protein
VSIATKISIPGESWEIICRKRRNNIDAIYQKRVIENPIIDAGYWILDKRKKTALVFSGNPASTIQ